MSKEKLEYWKHISEEIVWKLECRNYASKIVEMLDQPECKEDLFLDEMLTILEEWKLYTEYGIDIHKNVYRKEEWNQRNESVSFASILYITPQLSPDLEKYMQVFSACTHQDLTEELIQENDKEWKEKCFRNRLGKNCSYYLNFPPIHSYRSSCPSVFSPWMFLNSQTMIATNENKKIGSTNVLYPDFRESSVLWLEYLMDHFLTPSGHMLNGWIQILEEEKPYRKVIVSDSKMTMIE